MIQNSDAVQKTLISKNKDSSFQQNAAVDPSIYFHKKKRLLKGLQHLEILKNIINLSLHCRNCLYF